MSCEDINVCICIEKLIDICFAFKNDKTTVKLLIFDYHKKEMNDRIQS